MEKNNSALRKQKTVIESPNVVKQNFKTKPADNRLKVKKQILAFENKHEKIN